MKLLRCCVVFFCISIMACHNVKQISEKDSFFEGTVTYLVKYQPYTTHFKEEALKEFICSKIIFTFKNGNYRKQYVSSNGKIISERYLDLKHKKSYLKQMDNDTMYWFDITKRDNKATFKPLRDTIITNYNLRGIETESVVSVPDLGTDSIKLKGIFYFSKKYKVNPDWYKDYHEDNFDEMINYGKGIQLFELHKGFFWEQYIYVETVTPETIDTLVIQPLMDENTILKEL